MSEVTKSSAIKTTHHKDLVSLEIKNDDAWPTRYTIFLGPRDNKNRTRIEFSEENFADLLVLIDTIRAPQIEPEPVVVR